MAMHYGETTPAEDITFAQAHLRTLFLRSVLED